MARRRVIADSDDEDGGDELMSPLKDDAHPPEPEPLSPQHRPSSPRVPNSHIHISDTTDQSFFASVYDEQQSRALNQSRLIENIVRQSQKASASSGDVSLPAQGKGKGKKANVSSATNVTSPVVLKRPVNHQSLFSDDATEVTTPQKSTGGEWDIPSSPELVTTLRSQKGSKSKSEKTYGKQRKSQPNSTADSAAAEIFTRNGRIERGAEDELTLEEMPTENKINQTPKLPALKKRKVSLHDSVQDSTNFYIAESNLTTMQKLEYQKVNASQHSKSGIPGTLNTLKSSCATTIAYPTPSRYSSSGPPLPWERAPVSGESPANVIDITSSPDVFAAGHDQSEKEAAVVAHMETPIVQDEAIPPIRSSPEALPPKKRKRISRDAQDEDELVQDEPWASDTFSHNQESYKPQPSRRRSTTAEADKGGNDDKQNIALNAHEKDSGEAPRISAKESRVTTIDTSELDQPETEQTPQPKKRGRKKKQLTSEQIIQKEQDAEYQATTQEPTSISEASKAQVELEKPKKKRGRPRKSEAANPETLVPPGSEAPVAAETRNDNVPQDDTASEKASVSAEKGKTKKNIPKQKEELQDLNDSTARRDSSPLKETNSNPRTPVQGSSPEEVSTKPTESKNQNLQPKSQSTVTPKPAGSQTKSLYRVGLSKRTRIAPLLKSIRK
ncbi:hypothetical protein F5B20DRAFT_525344 [Whalleya microplaca]|nr:hypothetical protein F5B20DRAFT_525344 [Whalleya microplaca]